MDNVVCTENILDTYEQTLPEKADTLIDSSKKMEVIAEVHCDINGIKQKSTKTYHDYYHQNKGMIQLPKYLFCRGYQSAC